MKITVCVIRTVCFGALIWARPGVCAPGEGGGAEAGSEQRVIEPSSPHHESLVRAIKDRCLLHFGYRGHVRVVEPHAYGVSSAGVVVLHAYQVAGGSGSQPPPGWRTFAVADMNDVLVTERRFGRPRADYSTERPRIEPLWAEVEAAEAAEPTPPTPRTTRTRPTVPDSAAEATDGTEATE